MRSSDWVIARTANVADLRGSCGQVPGGSRSLGTDHAAAAECDDDVLRPATFDLTDGPHGGQRTNQCVDDLLGRKGVSRVLADQAAVQFLCPPNRVQVRCKRRPVTVVFHARLSWRQPLDKVAGHAVPHERCPRANADGRTSVFNSSLANSTLESACRNHVQSFCTARRSALSAQGPGG